jgi:murein DD-endopeptidase MepM/ murein hydrolase activator NlpD
MYHLTARLNPRRGWLILALLLCGIGPAYSRPSAEAGAPAEIRPEGEVRPAEAAAPELSPEPGPVLTALPGDPRPGDPLTVSYVPASGAAGLKAALFNAQGRRLSRASFFSLPHSAGALTVAVLAVPSTASPGAAALRVEDGSGAVLAELPVTISARDFVSEEIPLNQANTNLRTLPDPRKTAEAEHLWAILSRTGTDIYTLGPFIPPVGSTRRTSFFGDRRVYRYVNGSTDTSIHAGVDYGVPTGTAVQACADGKVVLARPRIVTGNSVVLEHLPGVYSIYYHLNKILVQEGAVVKAGTQLGESGSTGLATGPHLHWEIRVSGENTDPDSFISRPVLDKDALLRKMNTAVSAGR